MSKLLCATLICIFISSPSIAATIKIDLYSEQIYIVGKISKGDFDRFEHTLRSSKIDVSAVNIISQGGSVVEALQIGRLIRNLFLATNAPNTADFAPEARHLVCSTAAKINRDSPCTCASACFLIWAGGVERSGNDIHIHRIAFDSDYYGSLPPAEAAVKYREALSSVKSYLSEMEIPEIVYEEMVGMPSWTTKPLWIANQLTWPPSFGEWLTARCGPPTPYRDGSCELRTRSQTTAKALREFRQSPSRMGNE